MCAMQSAGGQYQVGFGQAGPQADFNHVTDFSQIAAYGIMSTPALVINEKVVSFGRVLSAEEVVKILRSELQL